MPDTSYRGRRAAAIENSHLRITVLAEGGHIAEVFDKKTGVNPLWTPRWDSIEPSSHDMARHPEYGDGIDAKLLAGIMGHNLCLDLFGAPTEEETAAGMPVHGEASVAPYEIESSAEALTMRAHLPIAQIRVERSIELKDRAVRIREKVENLTGLDRPIGWTQHVTLGPPFLEHGVTEFRLSATQSKTFAAAFGAHDYLKPDAEFTWPMAPGLDGGKVDMRKFPAANSSSAFTSHLMDQNRENAFFVAFAPGPGLAFGYVWRREDFPWTGIWEENHSRANKPWNGETLTRGMEFGVSPLPESRRQMVDRGKMFGIPTYRWLTARGTAEVEYWVVASSATSIPESLEWPA